MPQHDLILDNASGAAFRADANNALAALGSTMKGPNAPPAPTAGMMWLDDNTPSASVWTLKLYDGADWISIATFDISANTFTPFITGNLGIGTSSPNQKLQVVGSNSTGFAGATLQNSNGNVGIAGIQFSSDATYSKAAIGQLRQNANGTGPLVFYVDTATDAADWSTGDEKMRIQASGNVGIATSSPSKKLEVFSSVDNLQIGSIVRNDQASTGVAAIGFNVSSSASGETTSTKAGIGLVREAAFGGGSLCFYNNNSGAAGDFTIADEKMRIEPNGNLRFNSGYGSAAIAYGVRAWVNFNGTGTVAIRASGGVTSITDNGTGDYTVNLNFTMPDVNYGFSINGAAGTSSFVGDVPAGGMTTTSLRINTRRVDTRALEDISIVSVTLVR